MKQNDNKSEKDINGVVADPNVGTLETKNSIVNTGIVIGIGILEYLALFGAVVVNADLVTEGRMYFYIFFFTFMNVVWFSLEDGKCERKYQYLLFIVVLYILYFAIQLLDISNWWAILATILYPAIVSAKYNIELDKGSNSKNNNSGNHETAALIGKIIGKSISEFMKSSGRRRR